MPAMVKIGPNDQFKLGAKATEEEKAAWEKIKGERSQLLPYVTAMENIRLGRGMYTRIAPEEVEVAPPAPRLLEDHTIDELKLQMLSLGIKTEKKMSKSDVIALIRKKLEEIEIVDDTTDEGNGA